MSKKTKNETITVANLCIELGVDPKKGRKKLRSQGWSAGGKRYPVMERDSKKFKEAVEIIES